jgi:hypothetical protein
VAVNSGGNSGGGSTSDWLNIANIAAGLGGGILQGIGQKNLNKDNQLTNLSTILAQLQQNQNQQKINATQLDPLAQQKSRANFAMGAEAASNATRPSYSFDPASGMVNYSGGNQMPANGWSPATKAMLSPTSAANSEAEFYGTAGMPYDLTNAGYGPSANNAMGTLASNLANYQDPTKPISDRMNTINSQKSSGGSWWKSLLGIAAPLAMNFILPGSGLLATGLKAGAGAAVGALTGGAKGAVAGAGTSLLASQLAKNGNKPAPDYSYYG